MESAGAPAGGVFVLFLLNVLDQYVHDKHLADKPELYHYFIEVRLSNTVLEQSGNAALTGNGVILCHFSSEAPCLVAIATYNIMCCVSGTKILACHV